MKKILLSALADIGLTFAFALMCIGAPIIMLIFRYDIYNKDVNKFTIIGIITLLIATFFVKFLLKAWVHSWELKWYKKLAWGIEQVVPLILISVTLYWVSRNVDFVRNTLILTTFTNMFSYLVAPSYVLNWKEGGH